MKFATLYHIRGWSVQKPMTLLINREGKITKKFVGYKNHWTLEKAFLEFLKG